MKAWSRLTAGMRFVFRRGSLERQMDEDLRSFIDHRAAALERRGMTPEEAERRARVEAGSVEAVKDEIRDGYRGGAALDAAGKDLGYALRLMRRAPGFTAAVVLTLALGIGGTSAMFTIVKGALLDPLPYADPSRLVLIWTELGAQELTRAPGSGFELRAIRSRARTLERVGGIWATNGTFLGDARPEQVKVGRVTGDFFDVLGATPLLGRAIGPEDEGEGKPAVIVLSYGLWNRRFGARQDILGQTVRMDGAAPVVIGVMPPGFRMAFPPDAQVPGEIQAWLPFAFNVYEGPRNLYYLRMVARLGAGVSAEAANEELAAIGAALRAEVPEFATDRLGLNLVPMHGDAVREIRPVLVALFAGIGLVLLIACANVAGLMLARSGVRCDEMTLRAAIGASRGRIFRQVLLESVVLAGAGGLAGLAVSWVALKWLLDLAPAGLLPPGADTIDLGILAFTLVVALGSGLLFGLVPAHDASRVRLAEALKERGRGGEASLRPRWRASLIVGEIAVGFVLVVGAGLLARSFLEVLQFDPGFRSEGVLTFELDLPGSRYPDDVERVNLVRRVEDALRALPGVESAGGVSHLPLDDYANWYSGYAPAGASEEEHTSRMADHRSVTPDYFRTIGAELVSGRFPERLDEEAGRPVVVIDEIVAREGWPGMDPVGREIEFEKLTEGQFGPATAEVVGVVRHIQHHGLTTQVRGQIYIPFPQSVRWHISFVARTDGDPLALASGVTGAIRRIDPDLAVSKLRPMTFYVDRATAATRFTMVLAAVFAGLALVLSLVGIYGVIAYSVNRRRREFGIRAALGARPADIRRQVVREGMKLACAGWILGAGGALVVSRMLGSLLFGITPSDPPTWVGASLVIPAAALLASWLPARRAARHDAIAVLRE